MEQPIFTLAANGFRYVGALILVLIFWTVFRHSLKESRSPGNSADGLPHIYVGILEILAGDEVTLRFGIQQDSMVGRSSRCDIALRDRTLAPVHGHIFLQGEQFFVTPMSDKSVRINGVRVKNTTPISEDDQLTMGLTHMRVRRIMEQEQEQ